MPKIKIRTEEMAEYAERLKKQADRLNVIEERVKRINLSEIDPVMRYTREYRKQNLLATILLMNCMDYMTTAVKKFEELTEIAGVDEYKAQKIAMRLLENVGKAKLQKVDDKFLNYKIIDENTKLGDKDVNTSFTVGYVDAKGFGGILGRKDTSTIKKKEGKPVQEDSENVGIIGDAHFYISVLHLEGTTKKTDGFGYTKSTKKSIDVLKIGGKVAPVVNKDSLYVPFDVSGNLVEANISGSIADLLGTETKLNLKVAYGGSLKGALGWKDGKWAGKMPTGYLGPSIIIGDSFDLTGVLYLKKEMCYNNFEQFELMGDMESKKILHEFMNEMIEKEKYEKYEYEQMMILQTQKTYGKYFENLKREYEQYMQQEVQRRYGNGTAM